MATVTVTVEKIGVEDLNIGHGTWSRTSSTGGTNTMTKINSVNIMDGAFELMRTKFTYVGTTSFTLGPAAYYHQGTVSQIVYWLSNLTITPGSMTASTWYYLYLDDSAIVSLATNLLTNTEIAISTTAPTWSATKRGWYNGEDRCIFAIYPTATDIVPQYIHDGGDLVIYKDPVIEIEAHAVPSAHTEALTIPVFCQKANVTLYLNSTGGVSCKCYLGKANNCGALVVYSSGGATNIGPLEVLTDTSQQVVYFSDGYGTGHSLYIYTNGYYFPSGM